MKVVIAGAGLTGLSAALEFEEVILVDAKQELGTPCRSPGMFSDVSLLPEDIGFMHAGTNCLRRSWLEKNLAISAVSRGVDMRLKTRIIGFDNGLVTSQGMIRGDVYIDALGWKSSSQGWPGDSSALRSVDMIRPSERQLIDWYGYISNSGEGYSRADGTVEIWSQDPIDGNWLEIMRGEHPQELLLDNAIIRGRELASRVKSGEHLPR